jgi:hypothetical protein
MILKARQSKAVIINRKIARLRLIVWIFVSLLISLPCFAGGFSLQIIDKCSDAQIGKCIALDHSLYEKNLKEMPEKTSSGIPFKRQSLRCGPGSHLTLYLFSSQEACDHFSKSYRLDFGMKESPRNR